MEKIKICIISKYPPVEGGVSAKNYWLAKALGERGHEVHVVTNALEVEEDYRIKIDEEELSNLEPENVFVYNTQKFRPPILRSRYFTDKLASLAIDVIRNKNIDLIYSHYLLPYSIAGFIAKRITNKPHVVRHAGSDIGRLYKLESLQALFTEVLKDADKVIGRSNIARIFTDKDISTDKIFWLGSILNTQYFNQDIEAFDLSPYIKNKDIPLFSYFGKVSELKKTYNFIDAASKVRDKKFMLLFVIGSGKKAEEFKNYAYSVGLKEKCIFLSFQPPWMIPSLMNASTCIVSPESEETHLFPKGTHHPMIVREAMACGKCVIMGKGVAEKGWYSNLTASKEVLTIDPNDITEFKNKLEFIIDNPLIAEHIGKNAYNFSKVHEDYESSVNRIEKFFSSLV